MPDQRLWRIDGHAHYDALNGLARNRINTRLIAGNWDEICRLTASLHAGTVVPSAILRTLQRGPSPSSLARALAELGRVIKTLHVLEYVHDPAYRRTIHRLLSRGERRNALARDVFHGQRGQLRKHYQVGQENQLDSLGIMINIIALWQTAYIQAALDHLAANGYPLDPADIARLSPLGHPTIMSTHLESGSVTHTVSDQASLGHIIELGLAPGGTWQQNNLAAITGARPRPPPPRSRTWPRTGRAGSSTRTAAAASPNCGWRRGEPGSRTT